MGKVGKAAPYPRLSREDGDDVVSESIVNQIQFIRSFVDKRDDIILIDDVDYSDDGYSGGNFNRPGWQKLMKDIDSGKVDTIITKDLSRMGRDYISMGEYIERIFPEKNIRYIAINDDIDTAYETPGLEYIQFKLMFNDFYIKDGSKKIRKIMRSKKEQGQYTGWKGIYGYKRDPNDKHKLIVDEEVRHIVVRMFELAKQGYGPKTIADMFSLEGIPNPSAYANLSRSSKSETGKLWCSRTVGDLLKNPTYIGNLTQGIRKKVSYKSKKEVRIPREDWIISENTHEPIINKETFDTVQELLQKNKNKTQNYNDYLLRGFLFCKECGHRLGVNTHQKTKRRYCVCNYYAANSKFKLCTPHTMNYDKLEEAVIDELKNLCNEYVDTSNFQNKIEEEQKKNDLSVKLKKELSSLERKLENTRNNIDKLYLDKLNDVITLEQYNRMSLRFKEEIESLTKRKNDLTQELNSIDSEETKLKQEETLKLINEFLSFEHPTRELLVNLIDKVEISQDKVVNINYKFKLN